MSQYSERVNRAIEYLEGTGIKDQGMFEVSDLLMEMDERIDIMEEDLEDASVHLRDVYERIDLMEEGEE